MYLSIVLRFLLLIGSLSNEDRSSPDVPGVVCCAVRSANDKDVIIRNKMSMRLFCLALPPVLQSVEKRVRVVVQTAPQDRSNEDLNILLGYFKRFEFFRELENRKSTTMLMLSMTCLQGLQVAKGQNIQDLCTDVRVLVVLAGSLTLSNPSEKRKVSEGELVDEQDLRFSTDIHSRKGCEVAYLTKEDLRRVMEFDWRSLRTIIDVLRKFEDLKQIKYEHLQFMAQHTTFDCYEFKHPVYEAGDQPDYWYGIVRGEFVLQKKLAHGNSSKALALATGKPKLLAVGIIQSGQCFGEEEIFLKTVRKLSVICQSNDNQTVKIPAEYFQLVIGQYPRKIQDMGKSVAIKKQWKVAFESKMEHTISNYTKIVTELGRSGDEQPTRLPFLASSMKRTSALGDTRILHAISQTEKAATPRAKLRAPIVTSRDNNPQEIGQSAIEQEPVAFGLTEIVPSYRQSSIIQTQKSDTQPNQIATEKSGLLIDHMPTALSKYQPVRPDQIIEDAITPRYRLQSNSGTPTGAGLIVADSYIREKEQLLDRMRGQSYDQGKVLIPIELGKYQKLRALQAAPQSRKHPPLNHGGKMLTLLREKAISRMMMSSPKIVPMKSQLSYHQEQAARPESMLESNKFDQLFFRKLE